MRARLLALAVFLYAAPALAQDSMRPPQLPPANSDINAYREQVKEQQKKRAIDQKKGKNLSSDYRLPFDIESGSPHRSTQSTTIALRKEGVPEPVEPSFPEVKYLEPRPPQSLGEKIDFILHGLYTPLNPAHDHYGYEIRRYMAAIGNADIYKDKERLKKELENLEKAQIVMKYWYQLKRDELAEIEKQIEDENATTLERSGYAYNSGVARTILAELQNWIDNNRKFLEFLKSRDGYYEVEFPNITFDVSEDGRNFVSLYQAREKSLQNIKQYAPWAMMVY